MTGPTPAPLPAPIAGDAVLSALWLYWRGVCGDRAMPPRRAIDPAAIPKLLPHLQMVDRLSDGRFRYRLTGTAIVAAYGYDATMKMVDDVLPPVRRKHANRHYRIVFETRRPIFVRSLYITAEKLKLIVSRLILPLGDDGTQVEMLLMGQSFIHDWSVAGELGGAAPDLTEDRIEPL